MSHLHIHLVPAILKPRKTTDAGGRPWDKVAGIGLLGDYEAWGGAAKEHGLTLAEFKSMLSAQKKEGRWAEAALKGFNKTKDAQFTKKDIPALERKVAELRTKEQAMLKEVKKVEKEFDRIKASEGMKAASAYNNSPAVLKLKAEYTDLWLEWNDTRLDLKEAQKAAK